MKLSNFFHDLIKTYRAEIEDHSSDSEGKDVLHAQLTKKRGQFVELLPMMEFAPEMVALCFHKGISFTLPKQLDRLVALEPDDFPVWDEIAQAVEFTPWAQKQAKLALKEEGGELFLSITAGLEYLNQRHAPGQPAEAGRIGDEEEEDHSDEARDDAEDGSDVDLEEAGAEWMAEQGFDRIG